MNAKHNQTHGLDPDIIIDDVYCDSMSFRAACCDEDIQKKTALL